MAGKVRKTCPTCKGSGTVRVRKLVWVKRKQVFVTDYEDCHVCHGQGEVAA
jgi:DnaJ-class molecular chaperone